MGHEVVSGDAITEQGVGLVEEEPATLCAVGEVIFMELDHRSSLPSSLVPPIMSDLGRSRCSLAIGYEPALCRPFRPFQIDIKISAQN